MTCRPFHLAWALLALAVTALAQEPQTASTQRPDVQIDAPVSARGLLTSLASAMRTRNGPQIGISTESTSADALKSLAEGRADVAIMTRPLSGELHSLYPDLDLVVVPLGMEVVALGISNDVWDSGFQSITQANMRSLYEGKFANWKQLGGPDEKTSFFNFAQGGGIWEILTEWLYSDNRKAPLPKVETVTDSRDARTTLEFTPGSIAPIGAAFVDGVHCHALGISFPDHIAAPNAGAVASGAYPIARPLSAVIIGRPVLAIRSVTEFLTSPDGQALIKGTGALGLDAVPKPKSDPGY